MKRITKKELMEALIDANEVCRSMNSITDRKGKSTNWEPFKKRLEKSLLIQHKIMYPSQYE